MRTKILLYLALAAAPVMCGQEQAELRENPRMESAKRENFVAPAVEYPSYVKTSANHIDLHGHDWSGLAARLRGADSVRVNIVHIGDSHLQADMGTAVTRTLLGQHYGSAGRGLIVPFKLAGTNEPVDYVITSETPMAQGRLLKQPWGTRMGFTGIGICPDADEVTFEISAREPFDSIAIYYTGDDPEVLAPAPGCKGCDGIISFALPTDTAAVVTLALAATERPTFHGINLVNGEAGVAYHVIGNNGATYGTYNMIPGFADDIARFEPALLIVSLGTNEAYNNVTDEEFKQEMRTLLTDLRRSCPDSEILLTTPSECQRKIVRRRRRRKITTYAVNRDVKRMRDLILEVAAEEQLPVYDFYQVAGGQGTSDKWLADQYLNRDRIHMTRAGYTLQGHLFTEALEAAFDSYKN
ncbi:MAG: hypothetical protein K2M19_06690 [Muribaculaceae bacterium]|nr:hypothetical protein [Muribaculaceae bacterium]